MPIQVLMPKMGESVEEATINRWLKASGDRVEEYEPLVEVNTDKVDTEIPSPSAGILTEILVPAGSTIRAGTLLALIGVPGENAAETVPHQEPVQAPAAAESAPVQAASGQAPKAGRDSTLGFISPVVARIAREQQVDLTEVQGSGLGGRITREDILNFIKLPGKIPAEPAAVLSAPPTVRPAPGPTLANLPVEITSEVIPHTPVRRAIAERMVLSKHTSPHVTTVMEADMTKVFAHREANKAAFARDGVNLTFTAYFIAGIIAGLKAQPLANSSWSEEGIHVHKMVNIGMATSLGESGLIVPVIRGADSLSLLGLARTINDLAARARNRQLRPEEVKGGTFTITNHGISGSLFATPIINQPQSGILGVGIIQKRVVVVSDSNGNDSIAIRPMVYLSFTFDHRILDGATADAFLAKVVEYLEKSIHNSIPGAAHE